MQKNDGPWYYEAVEVGYNGRITDFQCALGLSQLHKLDGFVARRQEIAARYREELAGVEGVTFQHLPGDRTHSYHLFVVHLDPRRFDRKAVFEALQNQKIAPQVHFVPVNRQPVIRAMTGASFETSKAEHYYSGCLSLPMFPKLTDEEQTRAITAFCRATEDGRR